MRFLKVINIVVLVFFAGISVAVNCFAADIAPFLIKDWEVGQFVEYQINSLEGEGKDHKYRLELTGEEKGYFWLRLDIHSNIKREISFLGLVKPVTSNDFNGDYSSYISKGLLFLFANARTLYVVLSDDSKYEISPSVIENQPPILKDTFYNQIPDEKNSVDYSRIKLSDRMDEIIVPAGSFDCYRFSVLSQENDPITEEGFDLWRSERVPILGIVKIEFSKTLYHRKRDYKSDGLLKGKTWIERFLAMVLLKDIPGRQREDMHLLQLLRFGVEKDT